jgi:hypothetical protein
MSLNKRRVLALAIALVTILCLKCAEKEGPISPYTESDPPQHSIEYVVAMPGKVQPNQQATVEAKIVDRDGLPVAGQEVHFEVDFGTIESSDTTDAGGIATVIYMAPSGTGYATIFARSTDALTKNAYVEVGQPALTVLPQTILADGFSTAVIDINLVDPDGNPVGDAFIDLSSMHPLPPIQPVTLRPPSSANRVRWTQLQPSKRR